MGPGASASHSVVAPKQQSVRAATAAVGSLGTDWVRRENARPGTTAWKVARSAVAGDLDFGAEDREAEIERLLSAGASVVETKVGTNITFTVMRDPEGNPFCVG